MILLKFKPYTTVQYVPLQYVPQGPEQFFSSLLALWIKLQVFGRVNKSLALAELSAALSLANFLLDGSTEATLAFFQSFGISCFPASGPLHLLSSLTPPPFLPRLIF